jgi:hypothetical protein
MARPIYAPNIADQLILGKRSDPLELQEVMKLLASLPNAQDLNGMILTNPLGVGQLLISIPHVLTDDAVQILLENHTFQQLFALFSYRINPNWNEYDALKVVVLKLTDLDNSVDTAIVQRFKVLKHLAYEL